MKSIKIIKRELVKAGYTDLANELVAGTWWPRSDLSPTFEMYLHDELKKEKLLIGLNIIGNDVYYDDKKLFTISSDTDSVFSIIKKIKKKLKRN